MHFFQVPTVLLFCLGFQLLVNGQEVEEIFHAKVPYASLLADGAEHGERAVLSSSILGDSVVDLSSIAKNDAVNLTESETVLYGPNSDLLYARCSSKSMEQLKALYQITLHAKNVYRLRLETVDGDPSNEFASLQLDALVMSGQLTTIMSGNKFKLEIEFTNGMSDDGPTTEIKIDGGTSSMRCLIPGSLANIEGADKRSDLHLFQFSDGRTQQARVRMDYLPMDSDPLTDVNRSKEAQQKILNIIRSELGQQGETSHPK